MLGQKRGNARLAGEELDSELELPRQESSEREVDRAGQDLIDVAEQKLAERDLGSGRFWQVTIETGQVTEVALDGGPLEHCDGMARVRSTLYVAINARNRIAVIELADDGSSGRVRTVLRSDAFAFPTAVAVHDDRLLVVNGQLDKIGGDPQLPFTVAAIPVHAASSK